MYNLQPMGKYKITLCTCLPCGLQGALGAADHLLARHAAGEAVAVRRQVRVLGCKKSALPLLSAIAENGTIPLVTSLSKEDCFWQSDIVYDMILAHKKKASMTPEPSKGMKIVEL